MRHAIREDQNTPNALLKRLKDLINKEEVQDATDETSYAKIIPIFGHKVAAWDEPKIVKVDHNPQRIIKLTEPLTECAYYKDKTLLGK
jgi:hypothetical protein